MNTEENLLEACSKASKQYGKLTSRYKDLFNCLFTNPLEAFGYERWTTDNIYFGFSNMPAISELFIETNAFEDQNVIVHPQYMSSFCTFIHPDEKRHHPKYNHFRNALEAHLKIRTSFCVIKRQINYCEAFVWNFKKPNIHLSKEKRFIISDFMRNSTLINACMKQFKKDLLFLMPPTFRGINILKESPPYKDTINPSNNIGDYSLYVELLHYVKIAESINKKLGDFYLSKQEQETIEFFLKTANLTNHPVEDLKRISLKLHSLRYSKNFERDNDTLRKIGLI